MNSTDLLNATLGHSYDTDVNFDLPINQTEIRCYVSRSLSNISWTLDAPGGGGVGGGGGEVIGESEGDRYGEESVGCTYTYENKTFFWNNCVPMDDPLEMKKPHKVNPSFMPILVTHALTFLIGVIGNVAIIASIVRNKATRNVTSLFLVSLAAADLLLLFLCVPLETAQYFLWTPHLSPLLVCKLSSYCELLSAVASVLNLTAVSLERYIVIVYPMRSRTFCTLSNCRRAIFVVWCVSVVLSVPAAITQDAYSMTYCNELHSVTVYHCSTHGDAEISFAVYRLVIVFVVPALLMCGFYARVIKALWVSTKKMTAMTRVYSSRWDSRHSISSHHSLASCSLTSGLVQASPSTSSGLAALHAACPLKRCVHRQRSGDEVKHARKQVIKMLILVIVLFMACWGPKIVFFVVQKNGLSQGAFKPLVYNTRIFLGLLPFVHSCLNPIIYSCMSTNFGRLMRRTCARENCSSMMNSLCWSATNRPGHKQDGDEMPQQMGGVLALTTPPTPPTLPSHPLCIENGEGFDLPSSSYLDLNGHTLGLSHIQSKKSLDQAFAESLGHTTNCKKNLEVLDRPLVKNLSPSISCKKNLEPLDKVFTKNPGLHSNCRENLEKNEDSKM